MTTAAENIFQSLPCAASGEVFSNLFEHPNVRIERIVSQGQCNPEGDFYDQAHAEWVLLLQGSAQLDMAVDIEDTSNRNVMQRVDLKVGSFVYIPAHCRHRVHSSSQHETTVWLAIHINERERS